MDERVRSAAADAGLDAAIFNPEAASADETFKALVFDASGIASIEDLREAYRFFHATIRRVQPQRSGDRPRARRPRTPGAPRRRWRSGRSRA